MVTPEELKTLLREFHLEQYEDQYLAALRATIHIERMRVEDDSEIPFGASKMGGSPDLPPGFVWQSWYGISLTFLAQFKLSEVAPYDVEGVLPKEGMLYFFYEVNYATGDSLYDASEYRSIQVACIADESSPLIRCTRPTDYDLALFQKWVDSTGWPSLHKLNPTEAHPPLQPCKIAFFPMYTFPSYGISIQSTNEADQDRIAKANADLYRRRRAVVPKHQLLGLPNIIQNPMEEESEEISNKWHSEELNVPDLLPLEERAKEWMLLFQIDSDAEDLEVNFVDMGHVYFWIRKQDLAAHDFSRVIGIMQCY